MQKFKVVNPDYGIRIDEKDLMIPFDAAIIDVTQDNHSYLVFKIPTKPNEEAYKSQFFAVFIDGYNHKKKDGFVLFFGKDGGHIGWHPECMTFSESLPSELIEKAGWSDLDLEKHKKEIGKATDAIIYVSHVCHRSSVYRKTQKQYEQRELEKDITNPAPKRQYLSGGMFLEWVDDSEEDKEVRKYIRHTDGWDVRGHYRYYKKSGKIVYVKPHHKGNPNTTTTKEFYIKEEELHGGKS